MVQTQTKQRPLASSNYRRHNHSTTKAIGQFKLQKTQLNFSVPSKYLVSPFLHRHGTWRWWCHREVVGRRVHRRTGQGKGANGWCRWATTAPHSHLSSLRPHPKTESGSIALHLGLHLRRHHDLGLDPDWGLRRRRSSLDVDLVLDHRRHNLDAQIWSNLEPIRTKLELWCRPPSALPQTFLFRTTPSHSAPRPPSVHAREQGVDLAEWRSWRGSVRVWTKDGAEVARRKAPPRLGRLKRGSAWRERWREARWAGRAIEGDSNVRLGRGQRRAACWACDMGRTKKVVGCRHHHLQNIVPYWPANNRGTSL
jgi:hypothetical protein